MVHRFHPKGYKKPYADIKCPTCGAMNKHNANICKKCLGYLHSGYTITGIK